jgi:hypothetical protein
VIVRYCAPAQVVYKPSTDIRRFRLNFEVVSLVLVPCLLSALPCQRVPGPRQATSFKDNLRKICLPIRRSPRAVTHCWVPSHYSVDMWLRNNDGDAHLRLIFLSVYAY